MACSFCREKGHTVKTCPKKKEEFIKVQRDRTNMFIQVLPALMSNPIFQSILWWQISKRNRVLGFTNKLVVSQEILGLTELAGGSEIYGKIAADIDPVDLPEGIVLGAILETVEDSLEFASWTAEKTKAALEKVKGTAEDVYDAGVEAKGTIQQHGYDTGQSDIVRYIEEGFKYWWKYGELPPQN